MSDSRSTLAMVCSGVVVASVRDAGGATNMVKLETLCIIPRSQHVALRRRRTIEYTCQVRNGNRQATASTIADGRRRTRRRDLFRLP